MPVSDNNPPFRHCEERSDAAISPRPIGLYIHWPFCQSLCPYCDFNSHVRESVDHKKWRDALIKELEYFAAQSAPRQLVSIFFGGGTPSLMEPETIHAIIDRTKKLFPHKEIEITLEANPTSIEADKFSAFAQAGINRVSIGVQSLRDDSLKFLGRQHNAHEAIRAIDIARKYFSRYSFDLIFNLPGTTWKTWEPELNEALQLTGDHLSIYELTIEQGTKFFQLHQAGDFQLPNENLAADLYEKTQNKLNAAGLAPYEISNYAQPGGASIHNLLYWQYEDFIGIGPGAHGRITINNQKIGTNQIRLPEKWLAEIEKHGHATRQTEIITPAMQQTERIMMGVRLSSGLNMAHLPTPLDPKKLDQLQKQNLIKIKNNHLILTPPGRTRTNAVVDFLTNI